MLNDPDNLDELYQTIILEHSRNPRNYGRLECEGAACVEGYNPLCGDQVGACAVVERGVFAQLHCFGQGCAISKASASLMTVLLQGQKVEKFYEIFELLQRALKGEPEAVAKLEGFDDLVALVGVRKFPARVKCAMLGWQSLKAVLEGKGGSLSV